jgi:hypothetical protein
MQQQLFVKTLSRCNTYGQQWKIFHKKYDDKWIKIPPRTAEDIKIGLLNFAWVQYSLVKLLYHLDSCRTCEEHSTGTTDFMMEEKLEPEISECSQTDSSSEHGARIIKRAKGNVSTAFGDSVMEAENLAFDIEDDDYFSAPIQSNVIPPVDKNIWIFGNDGMQVLPDCWAFWKDWGVRSHSTFFQTISLEEDVEAGLGLTPFPEPFQAQDCKPLSSDEVNTLELSAREMIDEAGPNPGREESQRVFLRGKERAAGSIEHPAKYLILNLEKDGVNIPPETVDISVDLDSLIWVVGASNFKAHSLELSLTPSWDNKAAFSTHNFVYVNLVSAPRNEDELNYPLSRPVQDIRLSQIPHIPFGFSGNGERRINIYAFFPRMIHKNEKNRRYATLLPRPVQELWYNNVIIPSCNRAFNNKVGFSEYIPPSLEDLHDRAGDRRQKHMLICNPIVDVLMQEIQCSVKYNRELLSRFGSFFILADGRGMKLATKQCVSNDSEGLDRSYSADFELVRLQFPDLDWDQMLDRTKGELYLDMGISFHSRYKEPLIGLWRLPCLRQSFDAMGMKKGVVHHLNTLGFYGGIKAEMKLKQKQETGLVSRLAYNLVFELVRNPGCNEYLCGNKDVVHRSPKFLESCEKWMRLFDSGMERSFGVRDEIRGLGYIIVKNLPNAVKMVSIEEIIRFIQLRIICLRLNLVCYPIRFFGSGHPLF